MRFHPTYPRRVHVSLVMLFLAAILLQVDEPLDSQWEITIRVPGDASSVREAIAMAAPRSVILMQDASYAHYPIQLNRDYLVFECAENVIIQNVEMAFEVTAEEVTIVGCHQFANVPLIARISGDNRGFKFMSSRLYQLKKPSFQNR